MRFKPWMLAPRSKAQAGPWSALPPPALAALASNNPSPMVRGYLLSGSWLGATGIRPSVAAPDPKHEAGPPTNTRPEPPPQQRSTAETSSLSLTIRVMEPTNEEAMPAELPPKQSKWRRLLRVIKGKPA